MALLTDFRRSSETHESELSAIATLLTAQLALRRPARRGVAALIERFDRKLVNLRGVLSKFDRQVRAEGGERALDRADLEEKRYFKRLRVRLHQAMRVTDALRLVRRGRVSPLYPPSPLRHDAAGSRISVMDAALLALHRVVNPMPQSETAEALGCYPDIPHSASGFVTHAQVALRVARALDPNRPPLRFLDVGCGGGTMVLLAAGLFPTAEGFDYDPAYVAAGQAALARTGTTRCRLFEANALTFEGYDQYDVIYFYQPMSDLDGLRALEDRAVNSARPGTIIIAPYRRFQLRRHELACARIDEAVYVTGLSAEEAKKVTQQARRIGPDVLSPDRPVLPGAPDWLRDLWLAAATNGYLPD
ncbi:MAG: class I SAM-dependent methyltransferase [Pseudorhodobacter sp.]